MKALTLRAIAIASFVLGSCVGTALAEAPSSQGVGRIHGQVTIREANGAPVNAEAIVYVVGFSEPPEAGIRATIAQKNRTFVPDIVAVAAGERVNFPNGDDFFHNVFSQTTGAKFDLGSFKKGAAKVREFPNKGVVDVYCNIHPEMAATILVVPNRRHSRRNRDGTYAIEAVPAGTWTVLAYARRAAKPVSASVTVVAGGDATVDFALVRGAERAHLNKHGKEYSDDDDTDVYP